MNFGNQPQSNQPQTLSLNQMHRNAQQSKLLLPDLRHLTDLSTYLREQRKSIASYISVPLI